MNKKGNLLIDLSIGCKINPSDKLNCIINNAKNTEIYSRITDLLDRRRYSVKLNLII
jgi:hypothetical protein